MDSVGCRPGGHSHHGRRPLLVIRDVGAQSNGKSKTIQTQGKRKGESVCVRERERERSELPNYRKNVEH